MESRKLSDEELIELAKQTTELDDDDRHDVGYYQDRFCLFDGEYRVFVNHLYSHYKTWSVDPIGLNAFQDMLKLNRKDRTSVYINKDMCNLNLDELIGNYVKKEREKQKEERLRKVSGVKPKTKRQDSF
jgi:hypothetical protein